MAKSTIALIYGTDTNNTEEVGHKIAKQWEELGEQVDIFNIKDIELGLLEEYSMLILGIPTWYYGEAQCDWDDFFPELEEVDFEGKLVAIFGCGDQEDYAEYFLDAMGMINDIVTERGAIVVGHWSTEGYDFEASKALVDDSNFVGLGIDEDRQPELTEKRVKDWCAQVYDEMCLAELAD